MDRVLKTRLMVMWVRFGKSSFLYDMDAVMEDMLAVGVREEDIKNRSKWKISDSLWRPPKREKPQEAAAAASCVSEPI